MLICHRLKQKDINVFSVNENVTTDAQRLTWAVFWNSDCLPGRLGRGFESKQLGNFFSLILLSRGDDSLFQKCWVIVVELCKGFGFFPWSVLKKPQKLVGNDSAKSSDLSAVLQKFTTQIERNILRVNNTLDESHPLWNNFLCLTLDQNLATVKRNTHSTVSRRFEQTLKNLMFQSESRWVQKERNICWEWELGVVVSKLGSQLKGCGFESCLLKYYMEMVSKPCQDRFLLHPILVHSEKENIEI